MNLLAIFFQCKNGYDFLPVECNVTYWVQQLVCLRKLLPRFQISRMFLCATWKLKWRIVFTLILSYPKSTVFLFLLKNSKCSVSFEVKVKSTSITRYISRHDGYQMNRFRYNKFSFLNPSFQKIPSHLYKFPNQAI
jgi:hypothetical protein